MIYCLKAIVELASLLKISVAPMRISPNSEAIDIATVIDRLTLAYKKHYYDAELGAFVSGPERQLSWAAASWAVIAGIPENEEQAAKAMRLAYETPSSVKGMTPYLHHYVSERKSVSRSQLTNGATDSFVRPSSLQALRTLLSSISRSTGGG